MLATSEKVPAVTAAEAAPVNGPTLRSTRKEAPPLWVERPNLVGGWEPWVDVERRARPKRDRVAPGSPVGPSRIEASTYWRTGVVRPEANRDQDPKRIGPDRFDRQFEGRCGQWQPSRRGMAQDQWITPMLDRVAISGDARFLGGMSVRFRLGPPHNT